MNSNKTIASAMLAIALVGCDGGKLQDDGLTEALSLDVDAADLQIVLDELNGNEPIAAAAATQVDPHVGGTWGPVIQWPLVAVTMANLPDGRVLSWSGGERGVWGNEEQTYSAIWNPDDGSFSEKFTTGHNMFCAGTSMTTEGEIFVVGGRFQGNSTESSLFDWRTDSWQQREHMSGGRWYPTTLALPGGEIYTASGTGNIRRTSGLWNRDEGWQLHNGLDWSQMARYPNPANPAAWVDGWPTVNVAPNGKLFHSGPTPSLHWIDQTNNSAATDAGQLGFPYHGSSATTMYRPGKLLNTGGRFRPNSDDRLSNAEAWTIDIMGSTPVIKSVRPMNKVRAFHNSVVLPNGDVAVIGGNENGVGFSDRVSVYETEIWNPETDRWTIAASASVPRNYHSTALLMANGRVLSAGGGYPAANHPDAQVWTPPYLYQTGGATATQPRLLAAPEVIRVGDSFEVQSDSAIDRFTFIRMSSTTHQQNTDQRFVEFEFTASGANYYELQSDNNPNILLPGYWMLFALNADGVPSHARTILVEHPDTDDRLVNLAVNGVATQSSTYSSRTADSFAADRAIDGNVSGRPELSLAHTLAEQDPWLQVDLGQVAEIDTLRIWNRSDSRTERLSNFHVFVSDTEFPTTNLQQTLANDAIWKMQFSGAAGRPSSIPVGQSGRFVRIQLPRRDNLTIAELQIFGYADKLVGTFANLTDATVVDNDWQRVSFETSFVKEPVVVMGPSTFNDPEPVQSHIRNLTKHGFEYQAHEWEYQDNIHDTETMSMLALASGRHDLIGVTAIAGNIHVNNSWSTVTVDSPLPGAAIVLAQLASEQEDEMVSVRIRNVSANGFSLRLQDEDAGNVQHSVELVNYIVLTEGDGTLDGRPIRVGSQNFQNNWATLNAGNGYSNNPSVIAHMQTFNEPDGVALRQRRTATGAVELMLQEESSANPDDAHSAEKVGWLAIGGQLPLTLTAPQTTPLQVDGDVVFTASASGSGLQYQWNFGDGNSSTLSNDSSITHRYAAPGHYQVMLSVTDSSGARLTKNFIQVVHPAVTAAKPLSSTSILVDGTDIWNVNPDNNTVTLSQANVKVAEVAVGQSPRTLAVVADAGELWVVNKHSASISVLALSNRQSLATIQLPAGSQPHGLVTGTNHAYVALEASGEIAKIRLTDRTIVQTVVVGERPRHLALSADRADLLVSHFISPPMPDEHTANPSTDTTGGVVLLLATADLQVQNTMLLGYSTADVTEHSGPGIPNYLAAPVISPDGTQAWITSKQDAILGGSLRSGPDLRFDQGVRAISSRISLLTGAEDISKRIDHDDAGVGSAMVFDPLGSVMFTALETNQQVVANSPYDGSEMARFDVGLAPQGLAISDDGNTLYVHNFMDRSVSVVDVSALVQRAANEVTDIATIEVVANEQLSGTVLKGKQLFYDARNDRLAAFDYISCASCHNDGDHDGRVWDFSQFGEGLRNTTSLRGKGDSRHGMLHWSGNFDEVHDFEQQIREFAGGAGLMTDAQFATVTEPLGAAKAGISADLDALAAYVNSLDDFPALLADLTQQDVTAGQALFTSQDCASCHSGPVFTDSASAARHNIGTITGDSGQRLGDTLDGIDTPGLLNLHETAPYLHDGSAATVEAAIAAHSAINLSAIELAQLSAYTLQLTIGQTVSAESDFLSNPLSEGAIQVDGAVGEWSTLQAFATDADDLPATDSIDWRNATMAHDNNSLYIQYSNDGVVSESWGYGIFIDTDNNAATGFTGSSGEFAIGADLLIEWDTVNRYTGTGLDWSWQTSGQAAVASNGNNVEIAVARQLLGDGQNMRLFFAGDNSAFGGSAVDYYPDTIANPAAQNDKRSLAYKFSGPVPATALPALSNPVNDGAIVVDGTDTDWTGTESYTADANDVPATEVIDWLEFTVAHDSAKIYLRIKNDGATTPSWGYSVYIDADNNSATGFNGFASELAIGAEYLLQWDEINQYTGTGTDWSWQLSGSATVANNLDTIEIEMPRAALANPADLAFILQGDNSAVGGSTVDLYPDNANNIAASAASRSLRYSSQ